MLNSKDYIDSGILELYVMGALSPEETADVERRAAADAVVAQEIRAIRDALTSLDQHHESTPRASLRAEILDAIDRDSPMFQPAVYVANSRRTVERTSYAEQPPQQMQSSPRYALAASWIVAVLGIAAAAYFAMQWRGASDELASSRRETDSLRREMSVLAHHAAVGRHAIDVMHDSAAQIISLAGTENAPDAHLLVCYHPQSSEVHLVSNLRPPPEGKTYQLWALKGDKQIDAGTFEATRTDLIQTQKPVEDPDAFAVTIEDAGGSPTPTLDALVAVGKL